jgi:hypothetical protein
MVQNIDSILARGERIEVLVDKTDSMAHQAHAFRRGARGVRRQMWWKNTRIMALSVVVCVVSDANRVYPPVVLTLAVSVCKATPVLVVSSVLRISPWVMQVIRIHNCIGYSSCPSFGKIYVSMFVLENYN